jgi:hypothetical protein
VKRIRHDQHRREYRNEYQQSEPRGSDEVPPAGVLEAEGEKRHAGPDDAGPGQGLERPSQRRIEDDQPDPVGKAPQRLRDEREEQPVRARFPAVVAEIPEQQHRSKTGQNRSGCRPRN